MNGFVHVMHDMNSVFHVMVSDGLVERYTFCIVSISYIEKGIQPVPSLGLRTVLTCTYMNQMLSRTGDLEFS